MSSVPTAKVGEWIHLSQDGQVAMVRLRRPPVNALTFHLLKELAEVVSRPDAWFESPSAVLFTAEGPHFSGGMDRDELHEPSYEDFVGAAHDLSAILHCPLPLVAGVQGSAAGTGFILAACADILVVDAGASVWLPEVELGLLGGAGYARRWLPLSLVRRMVLTGEKLQGLVLHDFGAFPPDDGSDVADTALRLSRKLVERPLPAIRASREILARLEVDAAAVHTKEMEEIYSMNLSRGDTGGDPRQERSENSEGQLAHRTDSDS